MPAVSTRVLTNAVINALRLGTGKPIGDAIAPASAGDVYGVVYPIPGGEPDGPVGNANADFTLTYQVTCVASTREQVQWMADKVADALLAPGAVVAAGAYVQRIWRSMNPGVERDDTTGSSPLFYSTPRYSISVTPSS